ncbi:short-chain dehydrogenase [Mycolicibacterium setense]|uniref:SDR family NAD(P)-dependent oxidoreductase n=1 Tax=Mycolicibacterium setense TaxID=431269 RepID=UPI0007EA3A41|nr:SDR family NAD(P)-dependent oxidoreductase [Mycolicibacterium setense]OBB17687.1 short-chain dehydrogenase [Mycolicibacterium setense]
MSSNRWTQADVPDQTGRVAIVTGSNTGLGFETARILAANRAHVVLAVRDKAKGEAAAARILGGDPRADLSVQALNLGSLQSIRTSAGELLAAYPRIDLLINNAGVSLPPKQTTEDGFELQFGTNHLGHFALTGLLLENMLGVEGSRVVVVSSLAHKHRAAIHFDDLQWDRRYDKTEAYAQSKMANLAFAYALQRRLTAASRPTICVAAHPGLSRSELTRNLSAVSARLFSVITQSTAMGALPTLLAATGPDVSGGDYYGPSGIAETRGYPKLVDSTKQTHDLQIQERLWRVSEMLTEVSYPI